MKIIVISLPTSIDRRKQTTQQLASLGIEFEFLDAVDGRTDDHPYMKNYDEQKFLLNRRRKAAPGEIGCYVSHILAWEKCVALNEPIVVLEDDFELNEKFADGLRFIEPLLNEVSFIRLERCEKNFMIRSSYGDGNFYLTKQIKAAMCTTGYAVSPSGAAAFLEHGRKICAPVDLYLRHTFIHKQLMFALIPYIIVPSHTESIIGLKIRAFKIDNWQLNTKHFFHKWFYTFGNILVNIANSAIK